MFIDGVQLEVNTDNLARAYGFKNEKLSAISKDGNIYVVSRDKIEK